MAVSTNAFEMAQRQFDQVASLLKLDPQVSEISTVASQGIPFPDSCAHG